MMKIAITHDWLTNLGGGENVFKEMVETFPQADTFSAIVTKDVAERLSCPDVVESWLGKAPLARTRWQWYLPLLSYAFRSFDLRGYDVVLASSYYAAHHLRASKILCYKHSPARAVFGDGSYLAAHPAFPAILKPLAIPQLKWFRRLDTYYSSQERCQMIANSHFCAAWSMNAYNRDDVDVIYPPVDVARFLSLAMRRSQDRYTDDGYWICWSRHAPQKRLDVIVDAAAIVGERLVLAGTGPATKQLKEQARQLNAPVEFVGRVSDADLERLILGAKGFVFPAEEDFGIAPVEACAAGLPIVAYGSGGVCDWMEPYLGELFTSQTGKACADAMIRCNAKPGVAQVRAVVEQFSREGFRRKLRIAVEDMMDC
jgi:glycosyltransferase involved in cell wall biosynthesis